MKKVFQINIYGDALGIQYEPLLNLKKLSDRRLKATIFSIIVPSMY
jgi:hypothetical protein